LGRYSLSATDPKAEIMVELESGAVLALTDEDEVAIALESPHAALGHLRSALGSIPGWSAERGSIYRVSMRREQAEALRCFCERAAQILKDFSDEADRQRGSVLERAAHDLTEALRRTPNE